MSTTTSQNEVARPAPIPARCLPRTTPPRIRDTTRAPRTMPPGVDHARPISHTSSVLIGTAINIRRDFAQSPILLVSIGVTSIARPILPPGSSG